MEITIIAAMTQTKIIGLNNTLPWHYKADLQHFKKTTLGKPLVMGRKTFESFGARPLPRREHIILSRDTSLSYSYDNVIVLNSVADILKYIQQYSETMIIGGREIYQQFLPYATKMCLSFIDSKYNGDTYFPNIDWNEWQHNEMQCYNDFSVQQFVRKKQ
ncbi:MAG: hypothetical protein COC15_01485 [Legionellales bacterium]|nr:MAG: hypothetical protein COC15_01485 [Legionellales bacterium]